MNVFPAYRTYSRAAANRQRSRNDQLLFTENTFETPEISAQENPRNKTSTGKKKEEESKLPDVSKEQKKKAPAKTKSKTSVPMEPVRQRGQLKKGRQSKPIGKPVVLPGCQPKRRTDSQKKPGILPKLEMTKSFDKVTEWLEKSREYQCEDDDDFYFDDDFPSKEVMRGEEQMSGEQRRQKLFDFQKMWEQQVPASKPYLSQDIQMEKQDFFAQLRMKTGGLKPRRNRDDTPITRDLHPGHAQLADSVEPSTYTEELLTTGQSSDAAMYTDSNQYTATPIGESTRPMTNTGCTTDPTVAETVTAVSQQFLDPPTVTITAPDKDIQKQKRFLSSTAHFDGRDTPKFPTDMSSINSSDISARKKKAEKTPQKSADFKVPGSPSKRHVKSQRKGRLEPKHSTRLFTTRFEELTDELPQMSTIRLENTDAAKTLVSSHTEGDKNTDDLEFMDDEPGPIKTSTPNKGGSKAGKQRLEFDVSSVDVDSGDDLLQINKSSREINSEEIINLSDIMIDPEQDPLTKYKELQSRVTKDNELIESTKALQVNNVHERRNATKSDNEETIRQTQHLTQTPASILKRLMNKSARKSYDKENRVPKQPSKKRSGKRALSGKAVRRRYASLPGLSLEPTEREDASKKNRSCHFEVLQQNKHISPNLKRVSPQHSGLSPSRNKVSRKNSSSWSKGASSESVGNSRKQVAVVEPFSSMAATNLDLSAVLAEEHGIHTCSLTTRFSCRAANLCMMQLVEKNPLGYRDFIKTVPVGLNEFNKRRRRSITASMIPITMANESPEAGQPRQPEGNIYEGGMEDLPSYGLSKFVNIANEGQVKELLNQIGAGGKRATQSTLTGQNGITVMMPSTGERVTDEAIASTFSQIGAHEEVGQEEVALEITQEEEEEGEVVIIQTEYPFMPFTAGGTQPLAQTSTVDGSQIGIDPQAEVSDEALFGEGIGTMMMDPQTFPSLEVKTTGYSRFRYQSERNTANKRPRQYEMDEEKRFLAEIRMENYIGTGKVIVYCVNHEGKLHPYQLFGNDCNHGVFVRRADFSKRNPILKLLKVSVTTPKAKEYLKSVQEQRMYLEELNVITENEVPQTVTDIRDKQVVYLMVKVLLEDGRGTLVCHITKEIRNKKEGTEFRIRTVIPPCAPVRGPSEINPDKNKVCVIVTDNTAFPKDVCVVLRKTLDDGQQWTRVLKVPQIDVIRKSVVEFTPPPFRESTLSKDVEVQLTLCDLKTGHETEPAIFTYKGTDEYGVKEKGRKRKLFETTMSQDFDIIMSEGYPQAESQTLQAVRKKTFVGKDGYATNSPVAMPPATSVTVVPSQSNTASTAPLRQPPAEGPEISIGGMRRTRVVGRQQPPARTITTAPATTQMATSSSSLYIVPPSNTAVDQQSTLASMKSEVMTPSVAASPAPVFSVPQTARPVPAQPPAVPAQPPAEPASLNAPEVLTQLAGVLQTIAAKEKKSTDQVSTDVLMQALQKAYNKQVSGQVNGQAASTGSMQNVAGQGVPTASMPNVAGQGAPTVSMPSVSSPMPQLVGPMQPIINPQVSSQLPKLKPNQMFAVINGQFVIINDDIQSPEPPVASNGMVQDIAGQEVLVQKMPIQHPTSDTPRQAEPTTTPTTAGLQHNTATTAGLQFQLTQNYTQQQSPAGYSYQQPPSSAPTATSSQQQLAQQAPSQQQPNSGQIFTPQPQFSAGDTGTGFAWHQLNTNLDDTDLEIDSAPPTSNQTDDDKNDERANSVETDTSGKVMEVAGEVEVETGFQNLPKIIVDASEESEGEGRKDTDGEEVVLDTSSEEDSDDMQS